MSDDGRLLDVSFVVNIHAGRNYLARTMRSLEASAAVARRAGLTVELLLALDRSPADTVAWAEAYRPANFDRTRILRLDNGSLGLSRQHGAEAARAHFVQFCDEDDLISSNTTLVMHDLAVLAGPRTIVVPEYLLGFGALDLLACYAGTDRVTPMSFIAQHPYVSRLFFHRSLVEQIRYTDVRLSAGYAYEDWHFNATAVAHGYSFAPGPGTVLFYRHRPNSLSMSMNAASTRQIPPTPLFEPMTYLRVCRRSFLRRQAGEVERVDPEALRRRFLDDPDIRQSIVEANRIEPVIDPTRLGTAPVLSNLIGDFALGEAYYRACRLVGAGRFTEVVLATDLRPEGADRPALDTVSALASAREGVRTLILLDRRAAPAPLPDILPRNATLVDLGDLGPNLTDAQADTIALRLLEASAPQARLHLASNGFVARFFPKYRPVLGDRAVVFHRTDDPARAYAAGLVRSGSAAELLSEYLESFTLVVADSCSLIEGDQERLDRTPEKWRLLYRGAPLPPAPDHVTRRVLALAPSGALADFDFVACAARLQAALGPLAIDVVDEATAALMGQGYDALLVLDPAACDYTLLSGAMAAGLVPLAPRCPALQEAEAGLAFEPPGDVASAEAEVDAVLNRLYATPHTALTLRRQAHERFAGRHAWSAFEDEAGALFARD